MVISKECSRNGQRRMGGDVKLAWDIIALGGLALLATGLWWVYPPLALIVVGAGALVFGLWGAKVWRE